MFTYQKLNTLNDGRQEKSPWKWSFINVSLVVYSWASPTTSRNETLGFLKMFPLGKGATLPVFRIHYSPLPVVRAPYV